MQNFTFLSVTNTSVLKVDHKKVVMENIKATHPLQLVDLDYLTIAVTEGGKDAQVLIITDHFTWYVQALVTSSQNAKCIAQALLDQFIVHSDLIESIVSDQGQNFEKDLISELCKLAKVWTLHTTPYHPQTNGKCECFNHILINMVGTLPPNEKSSLRDVITVLVQAYNCTKITAMGFSPSICCMAKNPGCQLAYTLEPKGQTQMQLSALNWCNSCRKD